MHKSMRNLVDEKDRKEFEKLCNKFDPKVERDIEKMFKFFKIKDAEIAIFLNKVGATTINISIQSNCGEKVAKMSQILAEFISRDIVFYVHYNLEKHPELIVVGGRK